MGSERPGDSSSSLRNNASPTKERKGDTLTWVLAVVVGCVVYGFYRSLLVVGTGTLKLEGGFV